MVCGGLTMAYMCTWKNVKEIGKKVTVEEEPKKEIEMKEEAKVEMEAIKVEEPKKEAEVKEEPKVEVAAEVH